MGDAYSSESLRGGGWGGELLDEGTRGGEPRAVECGHTGYKSA